MKRLIAAVILLSLAVAFAAGGYLTVCKKIDKMTSVMKNDREITLTSGASDPQRVKSIKEEWNEHETFLVSILSHDEIEEIEIGIMCLEDYDRQKLPEEYIKTLNECINALEHIKETEALKTQNIF